LIFNDWDSDGLPIYNRELPEAKTFVKVFAVGDKIGNSVSEQFVLYSDGTLVTNNIKLTGGVEWTASSSPSKNVYATKALDKPENGTRFNEENFPAKGEDVWHSIYVTGKDSYYCHTDDGGSTW
jgi:hypothetical protein